MSFAELLKKEGLDGAAIARLLGCSNATAYAWAAGTREPPEWAQPHWLETLRRLNAEASASSHTPKSKPRNRKP